MITRRHGGRVTSIISREQLLGLNGRHVVTLERGWTMGECSLHPFAIAALEQLRHGVTIEGELSRPVHVERLATPPDLWERAVPIRYRKSVPTAWLRIVLTEGRNRQVRRMTAAVGYPTLRLVRAAIGPFRLDDLKPGAWRELPNRTVRGAVARLESTSGQGTNDR